MGPFGDPGVSRRAPEDSRRPPDTSRRVSGDPPEGSQTASGDPRMPYFLDLGDAVLEILQIIG